MEDGNEAPQVGPAPLEVSQTDATKTASPVARQESAEQITRGKSDIDRLADAIIQAQGTEGFSRALMEFYEAKATEIRQQLPETQWAGTGLGKYESVSAAIREQLGEPKLEVSQSDATKSAEPPIRQVGQ